MAKAAVAKTAAPATKRRTKADTALLERFKDYPGLKAIERRLENPDLPGSLPIRLKDEPPYSEDPTGTRRKWYLRWINGNIEGRFAHVTDAMGYVPVRVDELQDANHITGLHEAKDGVVRRGDRGQEVLVKMPLALYTEIKRRQQEIRARREKNARLVKQALAEHAGRTPGSEAGDFVHDEMTVRVTEL